MYTFLPRQFFVEQVQLKLLFSYNVNERCSPDMFARRNATEYGSEQNKAKANLRYFYRIMQVHI